MTELAPAASILSFNSNATDSAKASRGGERKPLVATAGPVHYPYWRRPPARGSFALRV